MGAQNQLSPSMAHLSVTFSRRGSSAPRASYHPWPRSNPHDTSRDEAEQAAAEHDPNRSRSNTREHEPELPSSATPCSSAPLLRPPLRPRPWRPCPRRRARRSTRPRPPPGSWIRTLAAAASSQRGASAPSAASRARPRRGASRRSGAPRVAPTLTPAVSGDGGVGTRCSTTPSRAPCGGGASTSAITGPCCPLCRRRVRGRRPGVLTKGRR